MTFLRMIIVLAAVSICSSCMLGMQVPGVYLPPSPDCDNWPTPAEWYGMEFQEGAWDIFFERMSNISKGKGDVYTPMPCKREDDRNEEVPVQPSI